VFDENDILNYLNSNLKLIEKFKKLRITVLSKNNIPMISIRAILCPTIKFRRIRCLEDLTLFFSK
jgi:hypothetical protein